MKGGRGRGHGAKSGAAETAAIIAKEPGLGALAFDVLAATAAYTSRTGL